MMTRELAPDTTHGDDYGTWLGIDPEAQARPDVSRGTGAYVTPGAALVTPTGLGMDPSDPSTYSRPYNPQPGMFRRLHHDEARKAQAR